MRIETLVIALVVVLLVSSLSSALAQRMERPDANVDIKRFFGNGNSDTNATVGLGVELDKSVMNESPYSGTCIHMNVSMIGNTRTGIHYSNDGLQPLVPYSSLDYTYDYDDEVSESPIYPDSDNWGQWVTVGYSYSVLPFPFRFYGVDYDFDMGSESDSYVWVSSKGFAALDLSNKTSTVANTIPNQAPPNALITPLWTNLRVSVGTSRIRIFKTSYGAFPLLLIVWENFLDSSRSKWLTFSIGFQLHNTLPHEAYSCGDPVYLIYNDVRAISDNFVYGVENQDGTKGAGGYVSGSQLSGWNRKYIPFYADTLPFIIKKFYLVFEDQDQSNCRYIIPNGENDTSGINLKTTGTRTLPPSFWLNVAGTTVSGILLLASIAGFGLPLAPLDLLLAVAQANTASNVLGCLQFLGDCLGLYSEYQNNAIFHADLRDSGTGPSPTIPSAYMVAITPDDTRSDAALHLQMKYWILGTGNHSLNIKAVVEYAPYPNGDRMNVTTSTVLEIFGDNNGSFQTAQTLGEGSHGQDPMLYLASGGYDTVDYYNVSLGYLDTLNVAMVPPPGQNFDLYLYAPNGTLVASSQNPGGSPESIAKTSNRAGNWAIKVVATSGQGFYNLTVSERGGGDINQDGSIDILDAILLGNAFNTEPGDSDWNPRADLNRDGVVNVLDAIILSGNYGKHQ